ncbi:molecular chaperone HscB [Pancytospora philotis]|nr:molecular chaperone HscB [Pancytospora philotis]KAI4293151.1 molecular chaperone HscB [Pancytospora philotis]
MIEKAKEIFGVFRMPPAFQIDKEQLKREYYRLSKAAHPDVQMRVPSTGGRGISGALPAQRIDSAQLNEAYSTLKDDFLRAKLFTSPSEAVSPRFLNECLELEERISRGANLRQELRGRIAECKRHYDDPEWITRWAYYRRLDDMIGDE